MGVATASDEKRNEATRLLGEALLLLKGVEEALEEATDPGTWGADEYTKEYKEFLNESLRKITSMRSDARNIHRRM